MSDPEDNKDVDDTSADSSTDAASATSSPGEKSGSGKKSKAESPKPENGKDKDKPEEKADDNAPPEVVPDESTEEKVATAGSKRKSKVERSRSREKRGSKSKRIENVSDARIGFIGAGRMTDSIIRGFLNPKDRKITEKQLYVSAKSVKNLETFKTRGIQTTTRSYDIFGRFDCDIIFLAVHGFVIRNCFKLGGTRPLAFTTNYIPCRKKQIIILSLIGGVPLNDIKTTLLNPDTVHKYQLVMHRIMLNVSVGYNCGFGVLDVEIDSRKCNPVVRDLLQSLVGANTIEYLDQSSIDAACAVAGNGLAIVYYFVSSLADGGFKMGLQKPAAVKLATKSLESAARVLIESNKNPAELKDQATSPSGPTIYGLNVLDKMDCASGIQSAVEGCYKRIQALVDSEPSK